jgi:hypothetical protein
MVAILPRGLLNQGTGFPLSVQKELVEKHKKTGNYGTLQYQARERVKARRR